jgi:hypothetical protein
MLKYTWQVVPMKVISDNVTNLDQIITEVMVSVLGDEDEDRVVNSRIIKLSKPEAESFISYKDVTEQQVIDWAKEIIGQNVIDEIEKNLQDQMLNIHTLRSNSSKSGAGSLLPPWVKLT